MTLTHQKAVAGLTVSPPATPVPVCLLFIMSCHRPSGCCMWKSTAVTIWPLFYGCFSNKLRYDEGNTVFHSNSPAGCTSLLFRHCEKKTSCTLLLSLARSCAIFMKRSWQCWLCVGFLSLSTMKNTWLQHVNITVTLALPFCYFECSVKRISFKVNKKKVN